MSDIKDKMFRWWEMEYYHKNMTLDEYKARAKAKFSDLFILFPFTVRTTATIPKILYEIIEVEHPFTMIHEDEEAIFMFENEHDAMKFKLRFG